MNFFALAKKSSFVSVSVQRNCRLLRLWLQSQAQIAHRSLEKNTCSKIHENPFVVANK